MAGWLDGTVAGWVYGVREERRRASLPWSNAAKTDRRPTISRLKAAYTSNVRAHTCVE